MIDLIKRMFSGLPQNIAACFFNYNIGWQVLAIALTYVLVSSGFDWWYFEATRNTLLESLGLVPAVLGFIVPIVVPIAMYVHGKRRKSLKTLFAAAAVAQAELIGWLISSAYKVFTGRLQPGLFTHGALVDTSRDFTFGILRHGIFWGWPSSHTAVAFAMAAALITFYPRKKEVGAIALLYALAIGLGVSITIHWFSDFAAGAIIGCLVGAVVGKRFAKLLRA